jgi:hypothetical protein
MMCQQSPSIIQVSRSLQALGTDLDVGVRANYIGQCAREKLESFRQLQRYCFYVCLLEPPNLPEDGTEKELILHHDLPLRSMN